MNISKSIMFFFSKKKNNAADLKLSKILNKVLGLFFFSISHSLFSQGIHQNNPIVGAIYWGMWDSYGFGNPAQLEVVLSNPKYRNRIPFFGRETSLRTVSFNAPPNNTIRNANSNLRINADQQWIKDQELRYAADAGLDYFAYVFYGETHYTSRLYKSSTVPEKEKVKMCWILDSFNESAIKPIAFDMGQDYYQKVMDDRPLFYFFRASFDCLKIIPMIEKLKSEYHNLYPEKKSPYIVILGFDDINSNFCEEGRVFLGDAFCMYQSKNGGYRQNNSYEFVRDNEIAQWGNGNLGKDGQKRVLWTSMGNDRRPRIDFPVSWELNSDGTALPSNEQNWAENPTPEQISLQLKRAVDFVARHPVTVESNSILIYAWNEHDEGGWISPTIVPGGNNEINDVNLRAVKKVLNPSECNEKLSVPTLNKSSPLVIKEGQKEILKASCENGTAVWNTGLMSENFEIIGNQNITYQVKCVKNGCFSNERFIDIEIDKICVSKPFEAKLISLKPQYAVPPRINLNFEGNQMVTNGINFTQFFDMGLGSVSGTELTFDLGLNHGFDYITGIVALDDQSTCKNEKVVFYLRDMLTMKFLYTSKELGFDEKGVSILDTFKIDIRNIRYLRMDTRGVKTQPECLYVNWVNLKLECLNECTEIVTAPTIFSNFLAIQEGQSVSISAACSNAEVRWVDGSKESSRVLTPLNTSFYQAFCLSKSCGESTLSAPIIVNVKPDCSVSRKVNLQKSVVQQNLSTFHLNQTSDGKALEILKYPKVRVPISNGFSVTGNQTIELKLTEKNAYDYFSVRVGFHPELSCVGTVIFKITNHKGEVFLSPEIGTSNKNLPTFFTFKIPIKEVPFLILEAVTNSGTCNEFLWAEPRFECQNYTGDLILSKENTLGDIVIYPNPSKGDFYIDWSALNTDEIEIKLIDGLGRGIFNTKDTIKSNLKKLFRIDDLPAGKYVLLVKAADGIISKSIIVD